MAVGIRVIFGAPPPASQKTGDGGLPGTKIAIDR